MTSLHMAVEGGHIDTVKILVKHRADVNSQDFSGVFKYNTNDSRLVYCCILVY